MNSNFWKNKKVLVTGHTGFKGSWLTLWLEKLGAKVVGVSIDEKWDTGIYKLCQLDKKITDLRADISDLEFTKNLIKNENFDVIFHLAAQPIVSKGYEDPIETYKSNVLGTQCVLEGIRAATGKMACVLITTDKVYENKESLWGYRENDSLGGYDPYSSSKACCEILINSYRESYFNLEKYSDHKKSIASVRSGNVIGGGDWSENRIIPDLVRAYENNEELQIRNPNSIRPWQHVLEALSGYIKLAEEMYENEGEYCEAWNFGPEIKKMHSVKDIIDEIRKNIEIKVKYGNEKAFHETKILCLDITKSKLKLKWSPRLSFEETIGMTMEWYLNYLKGDILEVSLNQIEHFMK